MLKKAIIYVLISCFVFSPVFATEAGSFNVKVEYIYSEGDRMIVSWNEGKEKHTLYVIYEGDPIDLANYYKAGKLYTTSILTTQMMVHDDSGKVHLFSVDTNAETTQVAPQSTTQTTQQTVPATQATPKGGSVAAPETPAFVYWLFWGLMLTLLIGGISSAGAS